MLKQLFGGLACMNKKDKNKLALTAGPSDSTTIITQTIPGTSSDAVVDESLSQSIAIPEGTHLNTSQFMSNVLSDISYDAAACQNRATPIDFCTREVKADDDVLSVASRRRSVNLVTPSPIPEETEDNLTDKTPYSKLENVSRNTIFEPLNYHYTPRPVKLRKSIRARTSKSASSQLMKAKLTPIIGGSLRPLRAK
ncbi:hypothetical protein CAEBREN_31876 [Caenorhabditis brenneri]|uniref:Uncharacterized protein n=1 Tax=Caenorhabditis brenneri TaxID=135651 RepID=G0N9A9_CAEBE|nr:hypothetical protein CAEBREN_31876 [Caenorhabditis brenneri]